MKKSHFCLEVALGRKLLSSNNFVPHSSSEPLGKMFMSDLSDTALRVYRSKEG